MILSRDAQIAAAETGLSEARVLELARTAAVCTHPFGNRRNGDWLLYIKNGVIMDLRSIYEAPEVIQPTSRGCPDCGGDGCQACDGHGTVVMSDSEYRDRLLEAQL